MRVIVVSTEPPDPHGNAAGRWYYVLAKGLCERGHDVQWLAAYTREASAANAWAALQHSPLTLKLYPYPKRAWLAGNWQTIRRPYSYFMSEELAQDLRANLASGYDVVHLEQTWAGWLCDNVPRSLLSVHWLARVDMPHIAQHSISFTVSTSLMKQAERYLIRRFDTIRVLSDQDRVVVQSLNPSARVVTVPLALDPALYPFAHVEPLHPTVGLIGSMGWQPTRESAVRLVRSVWPKVKLRVPNAKLLLVGWGARSRLREFLDDPDVVIEENVPEPEPHFRRMSLMAFPVTNGSGMKVKVLEAMAYGVPVVTTREGIAGIQATDGHSVAIADDDDEFAGRVSELLGSFEARRVMRLGARRLLEEQYSPKPVLTQVETLYESLVVGSR